MTLRLLLGTCSLLAASAFAQGADPEEISFRFAPPDGTRVTTTYTLERSRTVTGQPKVEDRILTRLEGRFSRTSGGFEFSQRTLSNSFVRNGQPVQDPLLSVLAGVPYKATISEQGEMLAISGFAEVEAALRASLPPAQAAAVAPLVNEAALVSRERSEWNARYAEFAGAVVKVGDVFDVEAPQPLPTGGSLTYTVRTRIPGWEPCPTGRCVRVEQVYESDAAALAQMTQDLTRKLVEASGGPPAPAPSPSAGTARITGSLSRLIDPRTMLIHAERVERTLTLPVPGPTGETRSVSQHELRTYVHVYEQL